MGPGARSLRCEGALEPDDAAEERCDPDHPEGLDLPEQVVRQDHFRASSFSMRTTVPLPAPLALHPLCRWECNAPATRHAPAVKRLEVTGSYDPVTNTVALSVSGEHVASVPAPDWVDSYTFRDVGPERAEELEVRVVAAAAAGALRSVLSAAGVTVETDR